MGDITQLDSQTRFKLLVIGIEGGLPCGLHIKWYNRHDNDRLENNRIGVKSAGNYDGNTTQADKTALGIIQQIHASADGLRDLNGGATPIGVQTELNADITPHTPSELEMFGIINFLLAGSKARYRQKQLNEGAHMRFGAHVAADVDNHPVQKVRHGFVAEPYAFPCGHAVHLDILPHWRFVPLAGTDFEFVCEYDLEENVTQANYTNTAKARAMGVFIESLSQNAPNQDDVDLTALHEASSYPGNFRVNEPGTQNFYIFTISEVSLSFHENPNNTKVRRAVIKCEWSTSDANATPASKALQNEMFRESGNTDSSGVSAPRPFGGPLVPIQAQYLDLGRVQVSGVGGVPRFSGVDHEDNRPWSTPLGVSRVIEWITLPTAGSGHRRMTYPYERGNVSAIHFEGFNQSTNYLQLLNPTHVADGFGVEVRLRIHNDSKGKTYEGDLTILDWQSPPQTLFVLRPGEDITFVFVGLPNGRGEIRAENIPVRLVLLNSGQQELFSTANYWGRATDSYFHFCCPYSGTSGDRTDADAFTHGSASITDAQQFNAANVAAVNGTLICNMEGRLNFSQEIQLEYSDSAAGTWPNPVTTLRRKRGSAMINLDWQFYPTIGPLDTILMRWQAEFDVEPGDILIPIMAMLQGASLTRSEVRAASFQRTAHLSPRIFKEAD